MNTLIQEDFNLEEYLNDYMEEHGLKEKFWLKFEQTDEGKIYKKIVHEEINRLKLYHFFETGEVVDEIQIADDKF